MTYAFVTMIIFLRVNIATARADFQIGVLRSKRTDHYQLIHTNASGMIGTLMMLIEQMTLMNAHSRTHQQCFSPKRKDAMKNNYRLE